MSESQLTHGSSPAEPLVIVGMWCSVPGADGLDAFEQLLFEGRAGYDVLPPDRLDRDLYYAPEEGVAGKTYTELGGIVQERPLDCNVCPLPDDAEEQYDPSHVRFCETAAKAWQHAGLAPQSEAWKRTGVYVGHSGGTKLGGPLSLATLIERTADEIATLPAIADWPTKANALDAFRADVRQSRPRRDHDGPIYDAYAAAALVARTLGLEGTRQVTDAACASSLVALDQAAMAIRAGMIDTAIVGGSTYNGADNLILFSQSRACGNGDACPFDDRASGLISSEGYVAIVVTTAARAREFGLNPLVEIGGLGTSSDGRGKSLWAPRQEGQQLALERAYAGARTTLDVDTLECHATSTSLGDATELSAIAAVSARSGGPLPIGSAKSNLGHTLEAAGLIGLVKMITSMRRGQRPPSLGFEQPSTRVEWDETPVRVLTEVEPWTPREDQRTAGVSAFGIGGLNGHVWVREPRETSRPTKHATVSNEPIAVIGRGVVLPGAANVDALGELLSSGQSAIIDAPSHRWPAGSGLSTDGGPFHTPTNRGGYITNYVFDSRHYLVPPLQVKHANPAQFMLLDAVRQAALEMGADDTLGRPTVSWPLHRERTAVVVGTIFGGEFSNDLQLGLRLPELKQRLVRRLIAEGLDPAEAEQAAEQFAEQTLKDHPALLDETGSFTASTLASRIAKTFDVMGGAAAIDAGDASALAALTDAMFRLRTGRNDVVVCAVAQRAMDLPAFERLQLNGQLVTSGLAEDIPDDCSRVLPGEGVAAVILRRLSDAEADGQTVYATLDDVALEPGHRSMTTADADVVRSVGYLAGAHPLVRLVAESATNTTARSELAADDNNGQTRVLSARYPHARIQPTATPVAAAPSSRPAPIPPTVSPPPAVRTQPMSETPMLRFEAESPTAFASLLDQLTADPTSAPARTTDQFTQTGRVRMAIVGGNVADAVVAVKNAWAKGQRSVALSSYGAVVWTQPDTSLPARTAWLFPGQGSQYAGRPSVFDHAVGRDALARLDAAMTSVGEQPIADALRNDGPSGRDLWSTQAWTLACSAAQIDVLKRAGYRPDVVLGHSFGECAAGVAAGTLSLSAAVRLSRLRADFISSGVAPGGTLISVRATPPEIQDALGRTSLRTAISHHNAPRQTVVSVWPGETDAVKATLADAGLACVALPVSVPFHSSALADAEGRLTTAFPLVSVTPATCGFLSATSIRYLAEPADVHHSLVTQLTRPVFFAESLQRLAADGVTLAVEVGPGTVLSRLTTENLGNRVLTLPFDGGDVDEQLKLLAAARECVGLASVVSAPLQAINAVTPLLSLPKSPVAEHRLEAYATHDDAHDDIEMLDVTAKRKATATPSTNGVATRNGHVAVHDVAPITPVPATPSPDVTAQSGSANTDVDHATVVSFLTDLVVELTGYDPEVVDPAADLEAELGVDSIKKAQLIGELAEWAGWTEPPAGLKLDDVATLDQIASLAAASATPLPEVRVPEPQTQASTESADLEADAESIETLLVDLVVDQTGYDPDIVDLDADLEAELGVDSIKQAQLLGEVHAQFNLTPELNTETGQPIRSLDDFKTLRMIRDYMLDRLGASGESAVAKEPAVAEDVTQTPVNRLSEAVVEAESVAVESVSTEPMIASSLVEAASPAVDSTIIGVTPSDVRPQWSSDTAFSAGHGTVDDAMARDIVDHYGGFDGDDFGNDSMDVTPPVDEPTAVEQTIGEQTVEQQAADAPSLPPLPVSDHTKRFVLRTVAAPQRDGMPMMPKLVGPALVIGGGRHAEKIVKTVRKLGQEAHILDAMSIPEAEQAAQELWSHGVTPHIFITTPIGEDALTTIDPAAWDDRRDAALMVPFRVCQLWYEAVIDADLMDQATVIVMTSLGGDFGFGDDVDAPRIGSPEGGGVGGLVKAMLIEGWMRGFRTTPMKVIDVAPSATPGEAVKFAFRELAVPSYDIEIATDGEQRLAVQAVPSPLKESNVPLRKITRGGLWVITGGGRGITAACAMELAQRHDLRLHLLGTAPKPNVTAETLAAYNADRSALRRQVMKQAKADGQNSVEAWRDLEKAVEIEKTLAACRDAGIEAEYDQCDVSDHVMVSEILDRVRREKGPIRGVLHGAGAGQDSRFDRKRPDKVAKCLKAKIDGSLAVAAATMNDPLEWFVGFGSISGRFGANGHTDYSSANDMLAKTVGLVRQTRNGADGQPPVAAVTFHWHAWDDIGMATKPEAKLALEMIDMKFMPARDGIAHFLRELEQGGRESEVLITDEHYYRKFFPADRVGSIDANKATPEDVTPLLGPDPARGNAFVWTLDPTHEPFLSQHLVKQRPTLPFVVAVEAMAEAARKVTGSKHVVEFRNVEALQAIKFATDDPIAVTLTADADGSDVACSLKADVRRKDGRLVAEDKEYFRGTAVVSDRLVMTREKRPSIDGLTFQDVTYMDETAPVFHGETLRTLRRVSGRKNMLVGELAGPASVELFRSDRPAKGWTWTGAVADGCLYATALLAFGLSNRPSLPVSFGAIRFGRLVDPGEPLRVVVTLRTSDNAGASFDWTLFGLNGDVLINATDYRVGWLSA